MAESGQNERPDAASGGRDDAPQPVQGKEPIDKTGQVTPTAGVASHPGAKTEEAPRAQPSSEVTPRDVATDIDWPGAGATRVQDRPLDDGHALEQTGQDALADHAQAQGEARARLTAGEETEQQSDPRLPHGAPVGRAGPT